MSDNLLTVVLKSVDAELKPFGFRSVKGKKWFVRSTNNRTERFQLVVLDDKPGYRICPSVSVRFDDVEAVFHRTSGYEVKYQKDTPTVGLDLWSVYGKDGYQLQLKDDGDVPHVVSQLVTIFREKAIPYFSQFSNLSAVDAAINDHPNDACAHRVMPWLRSSTGAIVATLTNRHDYDQLISVYRAALQRDSNGYYMPKFESLLSDLEKMQGAKTTAQS